MKMKQKEGKEKGERAANYSSISDVPPNSLFRMGTTPYFKLVDGSIRNLKKLAKKIAKQKGTTKQGELTNYV